MTGLYRVLANGVKLRFDTFKSLTNMTIMKTIACSQDVVITKNVPIPCPACNNARGWLLPTIDGDRRWVVCAMCRKEK